MGQAKIDHLIINSPYEEPKYHWYYEREKRTFDKRQGRRPAGYVIATPDSKSFDDDFEPTRAPIPDPRSVPSRVLKGAIRSVVTGS